VPENGARLVRPRGLLSQHRASVPGGSMVAY